MSQGRLARAAIIGTGRVGSLLEHDPLRVKPHTHAGWYAACSQTTLVAGCDVDAERLRQFGEDWALPSTALFSDYREMLRTVRPDVVSICAYATDRLAMVEAAIAAGVRGLWVEKAIACSLEEAEAMAALVERHGVAVVVDQPRRGEARYLAVRRLIETGRWGAVESVHCLMSGHLIHTGIHAWDVLRFWLGDWAEAAAWLNDTESAHEAEVARLGRLRIEAEDRRESVTTRPSRGSEETSRGDRGGQAHIVFECGAHAFVSGGLKRYFVFQFDLVFEGGRVRLGNDVDELWEPEPSPRYSGFLELAPRGAVPVTEATKPMLMDLLEAMDRGAEPRMSLRHAKAAFRLGVALFQSNLESHRYITPDELRPDLYVASR